MRQLALLTLTYIVAGCTWVNLTESGSAVQIGYAGNVQQCEHMGVVFASTQAKVVLERDGAKVQEELHTLARNNAASLGATNILLHGLPEEGVQSFNAYRCPTA